MTLQFIEIKFSISDFQSLILEKIKKKQKKLKNVCSFHKRGGVAKAVAQYPQAQAGRAQSYFDPRSGGGLTPCSPSW
jgi:hypothetical protein